MPPGPLSLWCLTARPLQDRKEQVLARGAGFRPSSCFSRAAHAHPARLQRPRSGLAQGGGCVTCTLLAWPLCQASSSEGGFPANSLHSGARPLGAGTFVL